MCGCAGSSFPAQQAAPGQPVKGPQAPGYAWTGPQKRAAAAKPKKTPART